MYYIAVHRKREVHYCTFCIICTLCDIRERAFLSPQVRDILTFVIRYLDN